MIANCFIFINYFIYLHFNIIILVAFMVSFATVDAKHLPAKRNHFISSFDKNLSLEEINKKPKVYDWIRIESSCGKIYYLDQNNYLNDMHLGLAITYFDSQKCPAK